ncbi:MAG: PAS domain-containing protein [Solirubrobacterales bacterium]|nr:PAS domain-containing protein [Solirubrobacterales bacterium]
MTEAAADTALDSFLEFVNQARGFDFTGYKRSSVQRRVTKRMNEVGVDSYENYIDFLELHPEEFGSLFNAILINVTGFFRDQPTWDYLTSETVPALVKGLPPGSPIRIWSAGCSSGEEAYTLAMVMARALGDREFQERVKIYATDIDEEALDVARHGSYAPRQLEAVPHEALERFFERTDQRYAFRKDLRRCVIFGRNDLVQDAPISRIDLLVCRNTLMYFTAETQTQVLRRFHFALNDSGYLLLGRSEMLITHSELFTPVDLRRRLFRKMIRATQRQRERVVASGAGDGASLVITNNLREAAFAGAPAAQVVLDAHGAVVMANDNARRMLSVAPDDFGRPIQDLELSYRPVELRSHLDVVLSELRSVDIRSVTWRVDAKERMFDVRISPLLSDSLVMGTTITYNDVTDAHQVREELTAARRALETASEELQSTVEELETTNEELQSTNEELETTNEELQSTNEELETMNEELHSANEELETMNEELRHRTLELNDMNSFLETILSIIGLAVAVLDRQQQVQIWNGQAYELWGLASAEVEGQNLFALDFGLPVESLRPQVRAALSGASPREEVLLEATNRRGRAFSCRVTLLPLGSDNDGLTSGLIMMMEAAGA